MVLGGVLLSIGYVYSVNTLYDILQPHQRIRVDIILGKVQDKTVAFQTDQSMNAIGSGGFFGKGFLMVLRHVLLRFWATRCEGFAVSF